MKRVLLFFFFLLTFAIASELDDIKKDITYLSSEACFGRSLHKNGIIKAQEYIVSELENIGLDAIIQPVKYSLNMIIDTPVCVLNGDTLKAGYDYIPHPFSSSANQSYTGDDIECVDSARLAEVMERKNLSSLSSARRFLIKKSKRKDRDRVLLLSSGTSPLMSRQSDRYNRAVVQVNKEFLTEKPKDVYFYNQTDYKKVISNNIITVIKGQDDPDKAICFTAHYDHMGGMGDMFYPGANDNASGTAVLLSLARYYSENPPPVTVIFCFFTGEEQGLKGSWAYVKKPVFPLKNIVLAINLDMVGSGCDGYGIVGGNEQTEDVSIFEDIREVYDLGKLRLRHNAPNSDHFPFTHKGVPAVFFYSSGGEQPYHHPDDVPETLDWDTLENTVLLMKNYIERKINN